jgi:hypothetical protein
MTPVEIDILFYEGLRTKGGLAIQFDKNHILPAEILEIKKYEKYNGIERIPFSVIFKINEKNIYWHQGTYKVLYNGTESIEVFLVPIGLGVDGMLYEAVYS